MSAVFHTYIKARNGNVKTLRITKSGYIWDKRIFRGIMVIMICIVFYLFAINNFNISQHFYFNCQSPMGCENPFYYSKYKTWMFGEMLDTRTACEWCNQQFLPYGIYGEKKPDYFKSFIIFSLSLVLLGICMNHWVHNLGKKFDLGLADEGIIKKIFENMGKDEED